MNGLKNSEHINGGMVQEKGEMVSWRNGRRMDG